MTGQAHLSTSDPAAGFPCPKCASPIQFSLPALLQNPAIQCGNCGLELTIDAEKSTQALQALVKLNSEMDAVRGQNNPSA